MKSGSNPRPGGFGNGPRPLGLRSALAGSSQSRVCPGKGPDGGLWGSLLAPEGRHLLERLALGLGNHLPDEEGRQERHEGVDAVGAPTLQPLSDGKVAVTRKFETHCAATAMATACERIVLGKISEMSTQQMGPHDIMNEAV